MGSGSCADIKCSELNQQDCEKYAAQLVNGNLFASKSFTAGRWEPNADDGSPSPDHCYHRSSGEVFFNTRTTSQDATHARQKICVCEVEDDTLDKVASSRMGTSSTNEDGDAGM